MSRAFTKEEAPEGPVLVPPRAPLPAGVPNYVTPRGLARLRAERAELESERARLNASSGDAAERRRQLSVVAGRLALLAERVASARLVPRNEAPDVVRFGTAVTVRGADGAERRFTIVGVDEASADEGRVAFVAPIARAVIAKRVGDVVRLQAAGGEETLTVAAVEPGDDA